jgi:D-hexose-6-phosphate mutarotase
VIWNAWETKTKAINDLEDDAYQHYLCIEPGAIVSPIVLPPQRSVICGQTLICAEQDSAADNARL